ncbi:hypothetical protein BGZ46_003994 [Entomortierella lignicola]|nr:hypothetical protein BGZ46_003994 [Entomortierella lignicola]
MSHSDSIASLISSDIHSDTQGSTRTSHVAATPLSSSSSSSPTPGPVSQQQYQRPELAFSTAAGLHVSLHGTIEFLAQLVKALERYLLNNSGSSGSSGGNNDNSRAGPRRVSQTISSATAATSTNLPSSVSGLVLSAELIQLNVGIVYEVLDECMELGYPVMPSLAQLDLLVFGVAKTS